MAYWTPYSTDPIFSNWCRIQGQILVLGWRQCNHTEKEQNLSCGLRDWAIWMIGSVLIKSFLLILFVILKILFISADIHLNCWNKLFGIMGYNTVNLCLIFFCLINEWYFRYSFSGNSSAINKIAKLSRKRNRDSEASGWSDLINCISESSGYLWVSYQHLLFLGFL